MMVRLAVFDFDGTLSRDYISMNFLDYIFERGLYSKKSYDEQMNLLARLKKAEITYDNWCEKWAEVWALGLKGQNAEEVRKCALDFFETFKKNIYPTSYEIIKHFKSEDYKVIFLSIGAVEVISLAARELGVDEVYGTELEIKKGVYTGKILTDFHRENGKEKFLREFLKGKSYDESVGFGDSDSDVGFMALLKKQIALNPSPKMEDSCNKNGWHVFRLNERGVVDKIKKIIS